MIPWAFADGVPFEWQTIDSFAEAANALSDEITPAQNSYGNWFELIDGALVTHDVCAIGVWLHGNNVTTQARDTLVTLGVDPTAGASYTDWIPHLLASCAVTLSPSSTGFEGYGVYYWFPVKLKAGTSIAAKASLNNSDLSHGPACGVQLYCKPTPAHLAVPGSFVQAFGIDTGNSRGTLITPGTTGEGAWVELGTLDKPIRFLDVGLGVHDDTMSNNTYHVDVAIGDATNKKVVIQSAYFETRVNEALAKLPAAMPCVGAIGDKIYGRAQVGPNAADANISLAAYGVG